MKMQVKSVLKSRMRFLGWALLLVLPMVLVTSCSKDDDEEGGTPPKTGEISAITGTYTGALTMDTEGGSVQIGAPELTIEAKGADSVLIKTQIDLNHLAEIGLPALPVVLDVECPSGVTFADGKYTVNGTTTVSIYMGPEPTPLPVSINGTITSTAEGTAVEINITPAGMDGVGPFKYTGTKSVK
ncbi:MAG: hypothetical protein LBM08_14660 [Dysgonamonadaceae bacterium]|jgi:hypothetical protein|nr:hypothetical protein [Dysgonamonadaceae bacterium]